MCEASNWFERNLESIRNGFFFHGTSAINAESIETEGFKIPNEGDFLLGTGAYFTIDYGMAKKYATLYGERDGVVFTVRMKNAKGIKICKSCIPYLQWDDYVEDIDDELPETYYMEADDIRDTYLREGCQIVVGLCHLDGFVILDYKVLEMLKIIRKDFV